jgi:hypothetical protein
MKHSLNQSEAVLEVPISEIINQNAAERVVELIAQLRPQLLMEVPFILAACQVYHSRKTIEKGLH